MEEIGNVLIGAAAAALLAVLCMIWFWHENVPTISVTCDTGKPTDDIEDALKSILMPLHWISGQKT